MGHRDFDVTYTTFCCKVASVPRIHLAGYVASQYPRSASC